MTIEPKIERGETKITTPYQDKGLVHIYPSIGPGTYQNIGNEILVLWGLKTPNGDYIASLLHSVYCSNLSNESEFQNIQEIMRRKYLWVYNRNLWTDKGVFVLQDPEAIGRSQPLDQNDLEKMLKGGKDIKGITFSKDKKLRFAPKESYKIGEHTSKSFAKDGFIIASCDFEGAEKIGKVSAKFKYQPRTWGLEIEKGQEPEQRVSLVGDYDDVDSWLSFDGGSMGGSDSGHAFGVRSQSF